VLSNTSWILAEIVRIGHQCDIQTAQSIVDNLVQRRTSLIWTDGDIVRVLRPDLPYKDQVLIILHHLQPMWISEQQLFEWVKYSNLSAFRRNVINKLYDDAFIHCKDGKATILPPGNTYVDSKLSEWITPPK
jgi:hypothetical protein